MRKGGFLIILFTISCLNETKILRPSTGLYSEIIFVVNDSYWQEINKSVFKVFSSNMPGINQIEPEYKVIQINKQEFNSIFQTHKNIVFIDSNLIENVETDKWATPQIVFQLNLEKEKHKIFEKLKKIKTIFEINELKFIRNNTLKGSNKNAEVIIKEKFNIDVVVPKEYTIVKDTTSFFWAAYNPSNIEEIKHIFVFSFNINSNNSPENVLIKTDSIFSTYLLGGPKGSYVKIEPLYPPIIDQDIYRGLWTLENGFMGGPFLIKTYSSDEKMIVAIGLIFAPQKQKRNDIKILEAIL